VMRSAGINVSGSAAGSEQKKQSVTAAGRFRGRRGQL